MIEFEEKNLKNNTKILYLNFASLKNIVVVNTHFRDARETHFFWTQFMYFISFYFLFHGPSLNVS